MLKLWLWQSWFFSLCLKSPLNIDSIVQSCQNSWDRTKCPQVDKAKQIRQSKTQQQKSLAPLSSATRLAIVLIGVTPITTLSSSLAHRWVPSAIRAPVAESSSSSSAAAANVSIIVNKLPANLALSSADRTKVVDHRMILHIYEIPARSSILRAAAITITISAGVGNESFNCLSKRRDSNSLVPKGRVVTVRAKERDEIVAANIVVRLVANVRKVSSVTAGTELIALGGIRVGVKVGAIGTACCIRCVRCPTGRCPTTAASSLGPAGSGRRRRWPGGRRRTTTVVALAPSSSATIGALVFICVTPIASLSSSFTRGRRASAISAPVAECSLYCVRRKDNSGHQNGRSGLFR